MSASRYDVVITGALCNMDIAWAEALTRRGLRCAVVRPAATPVPPKGQLPGPVEHFDYGDVLTTQGSRWFYAVCRNAKCILSLTGSVIPHLGWRWFIAPVLGLPPIINVTTGSDITELAVRSTFEGWRYRLLLRRAYLTVLNVHANALQNAQELHLNRFTFLRYPFLLAPRRADTQHRNGPITYLHPSHLDWGVTDSGRWRNSTKGNDRFLRAFFRAIRQGVDLRCIIVNRGPDREIARRMTEESGCADHFDWREPVSPRALIELFHEADVVVDQFDVGTIGAIAMEAMAQGKPVMAYIANEALRLRYDTLPPVLNCRSQDEIFDTILANQSRQELQETGDRADRWVRDNHVNGPDVDRLVFQIAVAAGLTWPIGVERSDKPA